MFVERAASSIVECVFLRAIALGKNLAGRPTSLSIYKQVGFMLASRAKSGVRPMQHIPRSQMDLAQKLHDIADEIWEERNWIPRDRPLWNELNNMATELHRLAEATAHEIGFPSLVTARSIENVSRSRRSES
jgi:hypothetical protein